MTETHTITIPEEAAGSRLDKVLPQYVPDMSRARLQALIADGQVEDEAGDVITDGAVKAKTGDVYIIIVPPAVEAIPQPEDIPLDIRYEDDDLLVINKPAGMVVHPAPGHHSGTLVNALLYHCGDSLSGIGGVKRPGIVHRLDKLTSGLMVVAKSDKAHHGLSAQLSDRTLTRVYQAIVWGHPSPSRGQIDTFMGRSKSDRKKMAVLQRDGKQAITDYITLEKFGLLASLVECRLKTGRTHQIRVHMAHVQNWLVGDPVYGRRSPQRFLKEHKVDEIVINAMLNFSRQALHAARLEFIHPIMENGVSVSAELPDDMQALLTILGRGKEK